jgi:hypothetical protein
MVASIAQVLRRNLTYFLIGAGLFNIGHN